MTHHCCGCDCGEYVDPDELGPEVDEDCEPWTPPPPLYRLQLIRHLDSNPIAEWPVDFSLDRRGKITFHVELDMQ